MIFSPVRRSNADSQEATQNTCYWCQSMVRNRRCCYKMAWPCLAISWRQLAQCGPQRLSLGCQCNQSMSYTHKTQTHCGDPADQLQLSLITNLILWGLCSRFKKKKNSMNLHFNVTAPRGEASPTKNSAASVTSVFTLLVLSLQFSSRKLTNPLVTQNPPSFLLATWPFINPPTSTRLAV